METEITIKEMCLNSETAIRIAKVLRKYEPEIWNVLKEEIKQSFVIPVSCEKLKEKDKRAFPECTEATKEDTCVIHNISMDGKCFKCGKQVIAKRKPSLSDL